MTVTDSAQSGILKTIGLYHLSAVVILLFCGCRAQTSSTDTIHPHQILLQQQTAHPQLFHEVTGTFSIVAVDPNAGACGAAVASRFPAVGKIVPYVRADVGAFCTQHWHNPDWGEHALDLLAAGKLPEQVLAELLQDDPNRDKRQLAIIDMGGRAANRNPANADHSGVWWGAVSGRYYAAQGNTLTGREVVFAMAKAYEETQGSLADRLMAALIAADCAGGDHRGRLAAGIIIAKKDVEGRWLELYVDKSDDAIIELAGRYAALKHDAKGAWPGGNLPFNHPCQADFDSAHYVTDYRSFFFSDYEGFWESPVQVYEEEVRVVLWQA